jgi:hypothetical protein
MFKLIGTVCILAVNNGQFDLCFNSGYLGVEYETLQECEDTGQKVVDLIEQEKVSRDNSMSNLRVTSKKLNRGKYRVA